MASLSEYVTLVSSDGFSFVVRRSSACLSGAIKRMLDPACMYTQAGAWKRTGFWTHYVTDGFTESKTNTCHFENMNGLVLEKVCEYFYYHEKYKEAKDVPDMDIPTELSLELLIVADYLDGERSPRADCSDVPNHRVAITDGAQYE